MLGEEHGAGGGGGAGDGGRLRAAGAPGRAGPVHFGVARGPAVDRRPRGGEAGAAGRPPRPPPRQPRLRDPLPHLRQPPQHHPPPRRHPDPGLPLPRHGAVRRRRPGELHRAERQGGGARGQKFHEANRISCSLPLAAMRYSRYLTLACPGFFVLGSMQTLPVALVCTWPQKSCCFRSTLTR